MPVGGGRFCPRSVATYRETVRDSDRFGGWYLRTSAKVAIGMVLFLLLIMVVGFITR